MVKKKQIIISLILLLIGSSTIYIITYSPSTKNLEVSEPNFYVSHSPIVITNDDNFTHYGFSGTGTELDPYLIENLEIITGLQKAISITGTTKFFVIQDCYIDGGSYYGIFIENVNPGNAKVQRNILTGTDTLTSVYEGLAIYANDAPGTIIANNSLTENIQGIMVRMSANCLIADNILSQSNTFYYGIHAFTFPYSVTVVNKVESIV